MSLVMTDVTSSQNNGDLAPPHKPVRFFSASLLSVCFALLQVNIEYAIVMPSLFLYMQRLNGGEVPEAYFGLVLGCFNMAQIATSPIFGVWIDRRPIKEILIFCLFLGVLGNMLYATATSVYMLFVARIISGVGGNAFATGTSYLIRVSDEKERSALTSKVLIFCYMGLLCGPALNYPLSLLGTYRFGPFELGPLNSPGFLMVFMLLAAIALIHLCFEEPAATALEEEETKMYMQRPENKRCCGLYKYRPLISSFTLVSMVLINMVVQFSQITLETLITPVTLMWYGFGQLENSLMYSAITGCFFLCFGVIIFLSRRGVLDRVFILIGSCFFGAAFISSTGLMFSQPFDYAMPLWAFSCIVACISVAIPFFLASMNSLFSKLVADKRIQGMAQSMMQASSSVSNIVAPIVTGLILPRVAYLYAMLLGCWGVLVVLLVLRWKAMVVKTRDSDTLGGGGDVVKEELAEGDALLAHSLN